MPEEKPQLLTQTKTRTKVLLGVALAVIIGGIIAAAGGAKVGVCKGGARDGKRCRKDKDCPAVATGTPAGKCTASQPNLPDLSVPLVTWDAEGTPTFRVHNFGSANSPAIPSGVRNEWLTASGEIVTSEGGTPQQTFVDLSAIGASDQSPTIGWGPPPPSATHLRIVVDPNNTVQELNENNTRIEPVPPPSTQ